MGFWDVCLGCARKRFQFAGWGSMQSCVDPLEIEDPRAWGVQTRSTPHIYKSPSTIIYIHTHWFCEAVRQSIIISIFIKKHTGVWWGWPPWPRPPGWWMANLRTALFPLACQSYQIRKNCEGRAVIRCFPLKMPRWGNRREMSKYDLKTI